MSEVNAGSENQDKEKGAGSAKPTEQEFVSAAAYKEVAGDMHKYKGKLKEAEAKLVEAQAKLDAEAREKLEKEKNFEVLYKQVQEKLDAESSARQTEREKFLEAQKVNALLHELGGVAKREYIRHANFKAIELNDDGTINEGSLKKEAERFRQEHFVLLKEAKAGILPTNAPGNSTKQPAKPAHQMSALEKRDALKEALAKTRS